MQQVNTRQVKIFARKLHIRTICDAEGFASRGYLSPAPPRAPVRCSRLRWRGSELLAVSFIFHDQMIRCGQISCRKNCHDVTAAVFNAPS